MNNEFLSLESAIKIRKYDRVIEEIEKEINLLENITYEYNDSIIKYKLSKEDIKSQLYVIYKEFLEKLKRIKKI